MHASRSTIASHNVATPVQNSGDHAQPASRPHSTWFGRVAHPADSPLQIDVASSQLQPLCSVHGRPLLPPLNVEHGVGDPAQIAAWKVQPPPASHCPWSS